VVNDIEERCEGLTKNSKDYVKKDYLANET
jgi:hypothetical protein